MNYDVWLTTLDNPFDPFENFEKWYDFEVVSNYDTCGHIARRLQIDFDDEMTEENLNAAIDKIIELDFANNYRKVYRNKDEKEV